MADIKIPISMDAGTIDVALRIEEQREDGTRATEISFPDNSDYKCYFAGASNEYAYVDTADYSNDVFSVEGWVYVDLSNSSFPFSKWNYTPNERCWTVNLNANGSISFLTSPDGTNSNTYLTATGQITTATWTHICVTYNGTQGQGNAIIYVNGLPVTTTYGGENKGSGVNAITSELTVAAAFGGAALEINGSLNEVRYWSGVRTPTEIADNWDIPVATDAAGLEGYWKFENNYDDSSIKGNDLTAVNTPTFLDTDIGCKYAREGIWISDDLDSGVDDSDWDMSSIEIFENPNSEAGTIKYQYAYGNSADPTNWNGDWKTKGEIQALSDPSGRYFRLKIQLSGDGTQNAIISDGWITVTVTAGGGTDIAQVNKTGNFQ